jgi:DNA polymerase-4
VFYNEHAFTFLFENHSRPTKGFAMKQPVLHVDMNNYYASVEEKHDPSLRNLPFAVCGDPEMRHSIVMSKNAIAKTAGVLTGISYRQAKEICPELAYIRADYPKYLHETKSARKVYRKYTDNIIPYGMDESWLVLEPHTTLDEARQIADIIRIEIMYSRGLSASVGVSDNLIFAKLGSDYKKPNAVTVITPENYKEIVWPLPASDLLFVGNARRDVLQKAGITTIGGIANAAPDYLGALLGKVGVDLWQFANGDDRGFSPACERIGSIGNTITPPQDIRTTEDASAVLYLLVTAVCARLKKHSLKANAISLCAKDSRFNKTIRQCTFPFASDNRNYLFNQAFGLFKKNYTWGNPLRSLGIRVNQLDDCEQLSLLKLDACDICVDINERIKRLTSRFGSLKVEKTAGTRDW